MADPVKKGTIAECLKHFARESGLDYSGKDRKLRSVSDPRNALCGLLQISASTGIEWFVKGTIPIGGNLLKLHCLLEMLGYTITERKDLNNLQRSLADYIALTVLEPRDIADFTEVNVDAVFRWARGESLPLGVKITIIQDLLDGDKKTAEENRQAWQKVLEEHNLIKKPAVPSDSPVGTAPPCDVKDLSHRQVIEELAATIKRGKILAALVVSDDYSAEERSQLRELTRSGPSNGVFDLSNYLTSLNRLCSERARKDLK